MNSFLKRAGELEDELIRDRRYFHKNAEVGLELPKTRQYVTERLREFGYDDISELCGGVVCTVGSGSPTILLRADMDALPQSEASGLPYACTDGACHSCGHDAHTAMLLTAARLLKEREAELRGTAKLMFQPGEEGYHGALGMINAGVLEAPHVDAALGMHCFPGDAGTAEYCTGRTRAAIAFKITVRGRATHGATPEKGASALTAAAAIVSAAESIPSMEVSSVEPAVLTFGKFVSGTAANINPDTAVLEGTIRVFGNETGEFMTSRLRELSSNIAAAYRCGTDFYCDTVPSFKNDPELCGELKNTLENIFTDVALHPGDIPVTDDFSELGLRVPAMMFNIGMQGGAAGYHEPHDPAMVLNEDGLKYGAACYAACAFNWLGSRA